MKKEVVVMILFVMILLIGCTEELEYEMEDEFEKIVGSITEPAEKEEIQKIADAVKEPVSVKEEEPVPEEKGEEFAQKEKKEETKKEVVEPLSKVQEPDEKPLVLPPTPKIYKGRITSLYPIKENRYTGELTTMDSSLRHYKFSSSFPIIRGDTVTFTLSSDQATLVAKELDPRLQKKQSASLTDAQPAGTVLGRVITVSSTREGTLRGRLRNAQDGEEYQYTSAIDLIVNDMVYYKPSMEPVAVVKKMK